MKHTAIAALAATTALSLTVAPAHAQVEVPPPNKPDSSSEAYQTCVKVNNDLEKDAEQQGKADDFKKLREEAAKKEGVAGSSNEGYCIGMLTKDDDYKGGAIALLTLVPLGIVALLGAAAAASGMIPGVALPAIPGM